MSKALELLRANKSLEQRATELLPSIQREVEQKYILDLKRSLEGIEDRLADAKQINLKTNLNEGQTAHSREECKDKLLLVLDLEYQLEVVKKELEIKLKIFSSYFKAASTESL